MFLNIKILIHSAIRNSVKILECKFEKNLLHIGVPKYIFSQLQQNKNNSVDFGINQTILRTSPVGARLQ